MEPGGILKESRFFCIWGMHNISSHQSCIIFTLINYPNGSGLSARMKKIDRYCIHAGCRIVNSVAGALSIAFFAVD